MTDPIPLRGDRAAWDCLNYPGLHAADIDGGTPAYHLPDNPTAGDLAQYNGAKWVPVALSEIKLDDWGTPDDNTDLNATSGRHGLLPKLSGSASDALRGDGSWGAVGGTAVYTKWDPDAPPASPSVYDDEFADSNFNSGLWSEFDLDSTMTVTEDARGLRLAAATHAGDGITAIYQALPSGDFTIETKLHMAGVPATYVDGGIILMEGNASGSDHLVAQACLRVGDYNLELSKFSAYNTFASTVVGFTMPRSHNVFYIRLRRNGSTYYIDWSMDGVTYIQVGSTTLGYTPAYMGLLINNVNSGSTQYARYQFFRYTDSDVGLDGVVGGQAVGVG